MAKSNDFPGNTSKGGAAIRGLRAPATVSQAKLDKPLSEFFEETSQQGQGTEKAQQANVSISETQNTPSLGNQSKVGSTGDRVLKAIPVAKVIKSRFQPRLTFDQQALEELADSIATIGLTKPIIVRQTDDKAYELIGGERRLRAHQLLGLTEITAEVKDASDGDAMLLALADNEGQEPLSDYEHAKQYALILQSTSMSIRALARSLGVNHSVVSRRLALNELPYRAREILDKYPGVIGSKWARDFAEYAKQNENLVVESLLHIAEQGWSQEKALRWLTTTLHELQNPGAPSKSPVSVPGVGYLRRSGKRIELKCDATVDAAKLEAKLKELLAELDPHLFAVSG
ncbi:MULTISPECIES: ParB/RepB/Spo0J family partition protein [unclassified Pseudomonas]|uniref:ParB/RepB/Spo0J family partition protein n=1 Tax=unclassified Pseudomonas TaxID=196821 RepID=UPI00235F914B|nr:MULTISPECIES: ParB/RepB/Spo0J family partition protein [unclassified Pseudomonas]